MPFNIPLDCVPSIHKADDLLLRPIRASDANLDFEAVMESREFLRLWEQSTWPEDGFTIEENRADLEKLQQRHEAGESFTYTVMTPQQSKCLGCVYVFPADATMFERSNISSINGSQWSSVSAAVYFWVRKSNLAAGLDRLLLDNLRSWLADSWHFSEPVFVTNEEFCQQVDMIKNAGLQKRFSIDDPKATRRFSAYGEP